jgi:DNA repair protein RadC
MLDISENDREVTTRIKLAGELLGIKLDDHLIVAENGCVSCY